MEDKKKDTKKISITKEDLKFKEWEKYNQGQGDYHSENKNENIMYQGNVKGNRWGW